MKMKWKLISFLVLLACVILQAAPVMAEGGGTEVTGTVPLVTSNVTASSITTSSAVISWQTSSNATSQVFYDIVYREDIDDYVYHTPEYTTPVSEHSVHLTGLSPSTTYHYRAKSVLIVDGTEFIAISDDYTFTTLYKPSGPPSVVTVAAWPLGPRTALLWGRLTDMGTASSVEVYFEWGKTTGYGFETRHQTVKHPRIFVAILTNLTPGTRYHFRAVAVGNGTSYGDDKSFTTAPGPTITVTFPNGGESWAAGTNQPITWTSSGVTGPVRIHLSRNGGSTWTTIIATTSNDGSQAWSVTGPATTQARIKVVSIANSDVFDISDADFIITGPP
jgi:phosphodiesterase/alkaline phosphatase D-like protein